jgi:hypothetical protein
MGFYKILHTLLFKKRRDKCFSFFCFVLFCFYCNNSFSQAQLEHLSLEHRFYIAVDRYKNKQLVTGMTIEADTMQLFKVEVELLLDWKMKHSVIYHCQLDTSARNHHFMLDSLEIPAIRLFDPAHHLEILIQKPVKHVGYTQNKEEITHWSSYFAVVTFPAPFNKYWKRDVYFHEK